MYFYGDYHTHTKSSDGHNSVLDVVMSARANNLKEVAITDHGFYNMYHCFALTHEKFEMQKDEVAKARGLYPDIKILHGIEADIVDTHGTIDMDDNDLQNVDILVCGFHRFVKSTSFLDYWRYVVFNGFIVDIFGSTIKKEVMATEAYIKAIEANPIDILSHVNVHAKVDVYEVCKACERTGTLVEINMKHLKVVEDCLPSMLKTDCNFIVNSDGHNKQNVGAFLEAEKLIEKYGIPHDRIVNLDKQPVFTRLNEYKSSRK